MSTDEQEEWTVRDLRRRWKPSKLRLSEKRANHPTAIRIHRACSWLQRTETVEDGKDLDVVVLCRWIAFNSLYGQWDADRREPLLDRECWGRFLDRILKLDADGRLKDVLIANKRLVMSIFDDEHLARRYWKDPTPKQAASAKRTKFDARTWYLQENWSIVLDRLIERIHLMRCQLAHGAATYNSSVNRNSLRRVNIMLGHLLTTIMLIMIDYGADEDWGEMPYPPDPKV